MGPLIAIALMFLVFWGLIILPQQRRVRAHQALVRSIEVGDEVMTTSGLYGTVASLDDDEVMLEVAPGTTLRFARGAIAKHVNEPDPEPADAVEAATEDDEVLADQAIGVDEGSAVDEADSVTAPSDKPE
ncbi:MAG: preprotein translocase subunit YajC [Acidimicrobiaceae bacterium]|jgi:preprotein translocase subunit YajC